MASSKHISCGLGHRTMFILAVVVTLHTTLTSSRPLNGRRWRSVASPETPWPETMSTSSPANNDNPIRNVDDSEAAAASTFSRLDVDDIITPPLTNVYQRPNGGDRPATDAVGDEKLCMTATPVPATRSESAPRSRWTAQLSSSPLFGGQQQLSTQSSEVTFAAPRGNHGRWRLKPRSVLRSLNALRGVTTTTRPVSGFVSRPLDVHPSSTSSSASASSVLLRSLLKREFDRKDKRQTYCCSMDMYCFNCSR